MFGTMIGNFIGISYFLAFQILGILLAMMLFKKEKWGFCLLMGSTMGSFCLQWFPVLFAFFLNFTKVAHVAALVLMLLLTTAVFFTIGEKRIVHKRKITVSIKSLFYNDPVLFLLIPLFVLVVVILSHHTISYVEGAMHSGQSTYGDMNMHLGFITSIAKQHTFPPEYSILPGTSLAYPFLSDSISSSVYLWGTSLRIAYLLPMFFALLQVFFGVYAVARYILQSIGSSVRAKAILAVAFFLFNGGFGFYYFLTEGFGSENFNRIFTAFYETPTNYVTENIQWHNIICDMLIPQRATLFGWAVLFPLLALMWKARETKNQNYFIYGGILAGGLVLIHTHSFLALGIICAVFFTQDLYAGVPRKTEAKRWSTLTRFSLVFIYLLFMTFISILLQSGTSIETNKILACGIAVLVLSGGIFFYYLFHNKEKNILLQWVLFLGIVLVLALPQLIGFTFRQAQGEQFVRGGFNWANNMELGDNYLMFYIKNLGILFILFLMMLIWGTKKQIQIALPGVLIWVLCEFILFQPNPYDNNKLLLVAYLFFCIAAADFVWDTIPKQFPKYFRKVRVTVTSLVTVLAVFAAVLTIGREYVSDYELYDASYVSLAEWVEKNTSSTDTFLTANNHNNAIASLTGRNIVCGSGTFLYYHGLDYGQAEADVKTMFENPEQRDALLKQYNVNYIVIGAWEQSSYAIPDYDTLIQTYPVVYDEKGILVLAV